MGPVDDNLIPRLPPVGFSFLNDETLSPEARECFSGMLGYDALALDEWQTRSLDVLEEASRVGARVAVYGTGTRARGLLTLAWDQPSLAGFAGRDADWTPAVDQEITKRRVSLDEVDWALIASTREDEVAERLINAHPHLRVCRLQSSAEPPPRPSWLDEVAETPEQYIVLVGDCLSPLLTRIVEGIRHFRPDSRLVVLVLRLDYKSVPRHAPAGSTVRVIETKSAKRLVQLVMSLPPSTPMVAVAGNDSGLMALVRVFRPGTPVVLHDVWLALDAEAFGTAFGKAVKEQQAAERTLLATPGIVAQRGDAKVFRELHGSGPEPTATVLTLPEFVVPDWCRPARRERRGQKWRLVWGGSVGDGDAFRRGDAAFDPTLVFERLASSGVSLTVFPSAGGAERYQYLRAYTADFATGAPVPLGQFPETLSDFDYGINFMAPLPSVIPERHFAASYGVRLYSYLEAGIPVLVSRSHAHLAKTVDREGIGLVLSWNDLTRLSDVLDGVDYARLVDNVVSFRDRLGVHRAASALLQF